MGYFSAFWSSSRWPRAGNVFPIRRLQRKPLVSDHGMHHGTCVTHVPWCMSGSLTCGGGENVPGIPGACTPAILRIWPKAHELKCTLQSAVRYGDSKTPMGVCHTIHNALFPAYSGTYASDLSHSIKLIAKITISMRLFYIQLMYLAPHWSHNWDMIPIGKTAWLRPTCVGL